MAEWRLNPDRYFAAERSQREMARRLYNTVRALPLVCPHGHVPPELLADPDARLASPVELLIIPDHYVTRMLYSQGVPLENLGVPSKDGTRVESDHRTVWQRFAECFHLFRGTPTGLWLKEELISVFGVTEKLDGDNAQRIYDHLAAQLAKPEFAPRALFERFNIEVLCTTDAATDELNAHRSLGDQGWGRRVRPTFRPDAVIDIDAPNWRQNIDLLSKVSAVEVHTYRAFIEALETRRRDFIEAGATATDHAALTAETERLSESDASAIFDRALMGRSEPDDADRFTAHMLSEMARMSREDGLVMQMHVGSRRNHNRFIFDRFGPDQGADIPVQTEWTRALRPLLNAHGNDPDFRLILFTLDESTYGRELAPLAGHYPALRLGPPWWFFDSLRGMERYLDQVVETAGVANLAGFNDDTRAFASIPVRHDLWRRTTCNWLAGLVVRDIVDEEDGVAMAHALAYGLAKSSYRL